MSAFKQGYQARKDATGPEEGVNPFAGPKQVWLSQQWMAGWEAAEAELKQAAAEYHEGDR